MSKRFKVLGGRSGANTHDVWQFTGGTRGAIAGSWSYDVYGSWGRSVRNNILGGNVRIPEVQQLLDAADGGVSECEGGLNLFGSAPISQECQDFVSLEAKNLTVVEQGIVEAVVAGDLFELPAGTVQSLFGASYRQTDFDFRPDSGLRPGIVAGFNESLPVSGKLDYTDVFAEVVVPLVADKPMVENLSLTLGARNTDNNIFGSDESWKTTFDWAINDTVRARGGFQHAIRSPNIAELFSPQVNNFPNISNQDPCNFDSDQRTGANAAQVQALCAAQSIVSGGAEYSQPFGQAVALAGGNPDLSPEEADSWTFGLVLNPLERLGITIDYFSIELDQVIASFPAIDIINRCYNGDGLNPTFDINNEWCQLFERDPSNGRVIELQTLDQNQSTWKLSGIDTTFNWGMDAGPGQLNFALLASWLQKFDRQLSSADPVNDFAGTIGNVTGRAAPEWRGTLQTSYSMDSWELTTTARYISSMSNAVLVSTPNADATGTPETWYLDLTGRYNLTDNASLRFGVNNVTDQDPRLYSPNVQANTDPSLYDVLGRRYTVGFEWRM